MHKLIIYKYQSFHRICLALIHRSFEKINDIRMLSVTNSSSLREFFYIICIDKRACIRDVNIYQHCKCLRHDFNRCVAINNQCRRCIIKC